LGLTHIEELPPKDLHVEAVGRFQFLNASVQFPELKVKEARAEATESKIGTDPRLGCKESLG